MLRAEGFLLYARLGNYERHASMPDGSPRWYGSGRLTRKLRRELPSLTWRRAKRKASQAEKKRCHCGSASGSSARLRLRANLFLSRLQKTAVGAVAGRAKRDVVQHRFVSMARMFGELFEFSDGRAADPSGIRKVLRKMRTASLQELLFRER